MTILISVTTLAYAVTRFEIMISYGDTRFQETEAYRADLNEVFTYADTNFNIAVSMSEKSGSKIADFSEFLDIYFLSTD